MNPSYEDDKLLLEPNFDSDLDSEENDDAYECQYPTHKLRHPNFFDLHSQIDDSISSSMSARESLLSYIHNGNNGSINNVDYEIEKREQIMDAFYKKRRGIRALAKEPGSHLNQDMILVSMHSQDDANAADDVETNINANNENHNARGDLRPNANNNDNNPGNINNGNNARIPQPFQQGLLGFIGGLENNAINPEEEERITAELMEREAAQVVANVIKRYRETKVPEDDFILIREARSGMLPFQSQLDPMNMKSCAFD